MNDAIGGYFELELHRGNIIHKNAIKLNTARNCLEYILKAKRYKKIYIPYYTCDVMLEPINKCNVAYEFYPIDKQLKPLHRYTLEQNEAFLYTNYFGLKQDEVIRLAEVYGDNLVVDNSQAFFANPVKDIDIFYSARKFFGVPDGAYLYTNMVLQEEFQQDTSYTRMMHLVKRIDLSAEEGYGDFRINDDELINQPILMMSKLTERLMESIDYNTVKQIRINNYKYIDNILGDTNLLRVELDANAVPMVYPYLCENGDLLKQFLIKNRIFVPTYWQNVYKWIANSFENYLVDKLLCLPIDQRYNEQKMSEIIAYILKIK